jgi:hypothetical protein
MSGASWAGGKNRAPKSEGGKDKEVSASFNKQFQWEEKELGPKDKGVDHDKIAAMQEEGRREDAAKKREELASGHKKAAPRADGITGPATATLPTMDIEKAAPAGSIRQPVRKASYTPPPRQNDAIDNVLAENGVGDGSNAATEGLNSVLGMKSARPAKHHAKHSRPRRHR